MNIALDFVRDIERKAGQPLFCPHAVVTHVESTLSHCKLQRPDALGGKQAASYDGYSARADLAHYLWRVLQASAEMLNGRWFAGRMVQVEYMAPQVR